MKVPLAGISRLELRLISAAAGWRQLTYLAVPSIYEFVPGVADNFRTTPADITSIKIPPIFAHLG
jgi:hypothetical protein